MDVKAEKTEDLVKLQKQVERELRDRNVDGYLAALEEDGPTLLALVDKAVDCLKSADEIAKRLDIIPMYRGIQEGVTKFRGDTEDSINVKKAHCRGAITRRNRGE